MDRFGIHDADTPLVQAYLFTVDYPGRVTTANVNDLEKVMVVDHLVVYFLMKGQIQLFLVRIEIVVPWQCGLVGHADEIQQRCVTFMLDQVGNPFFLFIGTLPQFID